MPSANNPLRGMMDANKLTGPNFTDWLRNLRILLKSERLLYVIEKDAPIEPNTDAPDEDLMEYLKWRMMLILFNALC